MAYLKHKGGISSTLIRSACCSQGSASTKSVMMDNRSEEHSNKLAFTKQVVILGLSVPNSPALNIHDGLKLFYALQHIQACCKTRVVQRFIHDLYNQHCTCILTCSLLSENAPMWPFVFITRASPRGTVTHFKKLV